MARELNVRWRAPEVIGFECYLFFWWCHVPCAISVFLQLYSQLFFSDRLRDCTIEREAHTVFELMGRATPASPKLVSSSYCIDVEMDNTRYIPLDADLFDPLRHTPTKLVSLFNTSASKLITGIGIDTQTQVNLKASCPLVCKLPRSSASIRSSLWDTALHITT